MCTALFVKNYGGFLCRNLDLEYSHGEQVTVMPRHFPLTFRRRGSCASHYAMIGTAYVLDGFPLYYDAVNECGLGMVGLNFPRDAVYVDHPDSIAPFELIPWVLSRCATVREATRLLADTTVAPIDYNSRLPHTPLHWLVSDISGSVAVEPLEGGLCVRDDPIEVLTNSPPLPFHLTRLAEYTTLTASVPPACFADQFVVSLYSRGLGAKGLPGDFSSSSRFIKAAFVKAMSDFGDTTDSAVSQCFHILDTVAHPRGCVRLPDDRSQITVYSSVCHAACGTYYYKTYDSARVVSLSLYDTDLDSSTLRGHPHITTPSWEHHRFL